MKSVRRISVAGILMVLMACESTASVAVQEPTTTTVDPLKAYVLDDPPMSNEHCARVVKLTRDYPRDAGDVPDLGPISLDLAWARNHRELLKRKPGPGIRMIEDKIILDQTLPGQANAIRLAVLKALGYAGVVSRRWRLPTGETLEHNVYGFISTKGARAYERGLLRGVCQYAGKSWAVRLPMPGGGSTLGIGLQFTKAPIGPIFQVSFIRGLYRSVISISRLRHRGNRRLINHFARMVAGAPPASTNL